MFNDPATGGARIDWKTVLGELLVFVPIDVKHDVSTSNGPADPVVADVHVLSGENTGDYIPGVWVFPKVLKAQLEPLVSAEGKEMVLGRLVQEPTTKGSPAWKLAPATEEDKTVATRWHEWRTSNSFPITSAQKPAQSTPLAASSATTFTPQPQTIAGQIAADAQAAAAPAGAGAGNPPF